MNIHTRPTYPLLRPRKSDVTHHDVFAWLVRLAQRDLLDALPTL